MKEALLTVGDLRKALEGYPNSQPVRVAVSSIENDFDGAGAFQIRANVHEYGMCGNIWSDGPETDATVQLSLIGMSKSINHEIPKKYFVKRSKDDPEGLGTYW